LIRGELRRQLSGYGVPESRSRKTSIWGVVNEIEAAIMKEETLRDLDAKKDHQVQSGDSFLMHVTLPYPYLSSFLAGPSAPKQTPSKPTPLLSISSPHQRSFLQIFSSLPHRFISSFFLPSSSSSSFPLHQNTSIEKV